MRFDFLALRLIFHHFVMRREAILIPLCLFAFSAVHGRSKLRRRRRRRLKHRQPDQSAASGGPRSGKPPAPQ